MTADSPEKEDGAGAGYGESGGLYVQASEEKSENENRTGSFLNFSASDSPYSKANSSSSDNEKRCIIYRDRASSGGTADT